MDDLARQREMRSNGHKIDAWRKTDSYKLYVKVSPQSPEASTVEKEGIGLRLMSRIGRRS